MARTGWHDGLSISKKFFSRVGAEDIALGRAAMIAGVDNEDVQKMRRFAMWKSLADYGVNFDIPEVVALRMQEFVESPALEVGSQPRLDPQTALFSIFAESCTERDMDAAEIRIAAGLPDPARFRRWMKHASEGLPIKMPEETRVAISEWLENNNIHVPEGVLVRKEMIGIHDMLVTAGSDVEVPQISVPVPDMIFVGAQPDAPPLPTEAAGQEMAAEPSLDNFKTASELRETLTPDYGSELQLSWGF